MDREAEKATAEQLQRYVEERYAHADYGADEDEGFGGEGDGGAVVQQGLLPTANDPGLWVVRCKCVLLSLCVGVGVAAGSALCSTLCCPAARRSPPALHTPPARAPLFCAR